MLRYTAHGETKVLRWQSYGIALILLTVLIGAGVRFAQAGSGDYRVGVTADKVTVEVSTYMSQNLTAYDSSFSLPQAHFLLQGENATAIADSVQRELRLKSPEARVMDLTLEVSTSQWSNQTEIQWFNTTLTFSVASIQSTTGGVLRADMAWRSFKYPADITINGVEINNIGKAYLGDVAQDLAAEQTSTTPAIINRYLADGRFTSSSRFPDIVATISTFNFTSLATPLTEWEVDNDPLAYTMSLSREKTLLGMAFIRVIQDPEQQATISYGLFYDLKAKIDTPGNSSVQNDAVLVRIDNSPETIMGALVAAVAAAASGTYLYERRLTGGRGKKPRR